MQKIIQSQTHSKTQDMQRDYYLNQKKAMEINPRHPLIKELLRRVEDNPGDAVAKEMALMMHNTATLRSGYMLKDTNAFALNIEKMMRETLGVDQVIQFVLTIPCNTTLPYHIDAVLGTQTFAV